MSIIIKTIEKSRIIESKRKKNKFIKSPLLVRGDFIIIWYINREKEKGLVRFQYNKGLCLGIKYKKYNTTFILRCVIDGISIEQIFFYYSINNIFILSKKNSVRYYRRNNLSYLRKKKNKQSKFIIK